MLYVHGGRLLNSEHLRKSRPHAEIIRLVEEQFQFMEAFRRLEDRIRELLERAIATPDSPELNGILRDLNDTLREHSKRLRQLAHNNLKEENRGSQS